MGDFSAEWLGRREPADHAARSAALTRDLIDALPSGPQGILDLACGTGSNMRYLAPMLTAAKKGPDPFFGAPERKRGTAPFSWALVDRDAALLAQVPRAPDVAVLQRDLSHLDSDLFVGRTLVTASALLDLVSEPWLHALARQCRDSGAAVLFALTYDGRIACEPEDPEDAIVCDLVNRHQKTDKGFGPALGSDATARAEEVFTRLGYTIRRAPSDWVLAGPPTRDQREGGSSGASRELQRQLIEGWAEAAASIAPRRAGIVKGWRKSRLAHLRAGRSTLRVGHQDIAGTIKSRE